MELEALKMYWASTADCEPGQLLMRQVIDGADMMVHVASGPTKVQVSLKSCTWVSAGVDDDLSRALRPKQAAIQQL